jgi:3'-phosphoadenosine 5'-phosphosulfate sulfotransferase (PAPS reductase)/FAD synthetase
MNERFQKLKQMQGLPLDAKIEATKRRIREWLDVYPDARVAFSGGKDSTVLLDIARQVSPGILASFANTGLEFPEIVEFVRSTPNVVEVRPKLDFLSVVQKYGYPVVSKRIAQYVKEVQRSRSDTATKHLRLTGVRSDGTTSPMGKISNKWQFLCRTDAPRVSDICCKILKKQPQDALGTAPIVGTMAEDSGQRAEQYYRHGCNAFDLALARSAPLSFWTEADVWEYIRGNQLPYSRIYDMGYHRTGCMFCMFGLHMEARPNRFERMAVTHPGLFRYCMDGPLKLREVIRFVYKMEMPVAEKKGKSVLD